MAPQKDNISSFLIAFSFCCRLPAKRDRNYDKWMWNRFKTIRSHGNEISQFAYEAMSKLISRNRSQLTCDQVQGSPQPKDAGSGTTVVSGGGRCAARDFRTGRGKNQWNGRR